MHDTESRPRPGKRPPPGPHEIRYILGLSLAYTRGLNDVIEVICEAMTDYPELAFRYAALVDHLRSLVSPGEGSLQAVERECRVLLGEERRA